MGGARRDDEARAAAAAEVARLRASCDERIERSEAELTRERHARIKKADAAAKATKAAEAAEAAKAAAARQRGTG